MSSLADFEGNSMSSFSCNTPSEFNKEAAAVIFAWHFENTNCISATSTYHGDFMRQVSPVCMKQNFSSSATYHLEVTLSSSSYEAGAALSNEALRLTYALEEVGLHREAAREVMRSIEDNLHATCLTVANTILADADVKKLSSRSLIGLIRSSSRAREELPAWNSAYRRSWNEVKRKDKNPEALFVGLPNPMEI